MTEFTSAEQTMQAPIETVYSKLSDLTSLKEFLKNVPADKIPEDKREMFENLNIEPDSIEIQGGPTGAVRLLVAERQEPNLIRLKAADIPLDLDMLLHLSPKGDDECTARVAIEADIPFFLKPMIAGPLQKVVDEFASVLGSIQFKKAE